MNARELVALELRNLRPFSAGVAVVLAGYVVAVSPLVEIVAAFGDRPTLLAGLGLLSAFAFGWTFAYLFGGFSAVVKRENDVYDRYFALPVAPWKVFLAEAVGVAVPAFACTAGTLVAVTVIAEDVPGWFAVWSVVAAAVFVVGTTSLVFVTTLSFDNPRAPTIAYFAGIGLLFVGARGVGGLPVGPEVITAGLAVVLTGLSVGAVGALTRLSGRRLHG
ncbi:hypothetical protein [Halorussus halobius]|uniref:hypothetical protein n=1 Tax=Halorussus halobius TaxID=1710537 RepID=UPI001091A633|nr:hypothetical protein [Halorussus halobius]